MGRLGRGALLSRFFCGAQAPLLYGLSLCDPLRGGEVVGNMGGRCVSIVACGPSQVFTLAASFVVY